MNCVFCFVTTYWYASLAIVLLGLLYLWSIWTHDYFKIRKVPYKKPTPLFGNLTGLATQSDTMFNVINNIYKSHPNNKFLGVFEFRNPLVMIRDPDLIKQITVKDFEHFLDHRVIIDETIEPLFGKNLVSLSGDEWKNMRNILSPAFTGSKIRFMLNLVSECAQELNEFLIDQCEKNDGIHTVDLKEMYTKYTNDVIATCAFGIKVNSFTDEKNEFYTIGKQISNFGGLQSLKFLIYATIPRIAKALKLEIFPGKIPKYFKSLIQDAIGQRQKNGIIRPDMIQLLMEARKGLSKEIAQAEETPKINEGFSATEEINLKDTIKVHKKTLDDDDITSQCLIFFLAGFETISNLLCFASHELAVNPDYQQRLYEEVKQVSDEMHANNEELSYEKLQSMKYLDMFVSETLRRWPPAMVTDRKCTIPYKIKDNDIEMTIEKDSFIWIPVGPLHHDPQYFPEPEKFDPERFSDENKHKIIPYTYLPFGAGPRNCIGSRFALMEAKAILFHLLTRFSFEVSVRTQIPLKYSKSGFSVRPEKGFWIALKPR
jgi:cytochrome P450 family 9